ncbi:glycosyltransferase family 1 protein [Paraburkholderia sp. Tr-20389]|uniref:glycosyltransferase n=1 Tax=Paraburkholderia sp. Tr-20389 TaxID=2703903 RepID=UPI00197E1B74|nr:glycosyltransferase [Paraburkholderia sp. Tr-20389]MBN3754423.1 glycosyltransferase family 1 protein [Paraburkholderia sp. Tr-20389]
MTKAFADNGFDEIRWIDPYPTRLPVLSDLKRLRKGSADVTHPVDPRVGVVRPTALPIEPLPMSGVVNRLAVWRAVCDQLKTFAGGADHCVLGIGRPSKLADWALRHVPHDRSFVDVLDNFPAFYRGVSSLSMRVRLRALLENVDDIYCSSSALAADVRCRRPDAVTILNGYPTAGLPAPSEAGQRRVIGYVGAIADWFDWPLVQSLAEALPDVPVRLIGPEFVERPANLPANIELIGEVQQERIAAMVQEFAVGLIPFRINTLTAGVDPIKFYEYRSLGVPVWSTAFGEMRHRDHADGVTHIAPGSMWRALWDSARTGVSTARDIASFRLEVDWSRRFAPMLARSQFAAAQSKQKAGIHGLPLSPRQSQRRSPRT